jgi:hypothetical protein
MASAASEQGRENITQEGSGYFEQRVTENSILPVPILPVQLGQYQTSYFSSKNSVIQNFSQPWINLI